MSRVLSHKWDNRTERRINGRYNGWTRRMRWYSEGWTKRNKNIRICFEDEEGLTNKFYDADEASAQRDWEDFKANRITALQLRNKS